MQYNLIGIVLVIIFIRCVIELYRRPKLPKSVYDGYTYELYCAQRMRDRGYKYVKTHGKGPDGGVDIRARKGGKKYIAQCKYHSQPVGIADVQRHLGVCTKAGAVGVFFSRNGYTSSAKKRAKGRVKLVTL